MLAYQQTTVPVNEHPKLPSTEVLSFMTNKVQEQLKTALEKLAVIYKWANTNACGLQARQLLRQYQDTVWFLLIETDERLKELGIFLRQCIDSCNLKDPRLESLLVLNRKHVECSKFCADLTGPLHLEIETLLELKSRAAQFDGVQLNLDAMDKLNQMRDQLEKMSE